MCAPVLVFRQKQNTYSTESISDTFIWTLLAHGEWRRTFFELRTVVTTQKKRSYESCTSFWPTSFKTSILENNPKEEYRPCPHIIVLCPIVIYNDTKLL